MKWQRGHCAGVSVICVMWLHYKHPESPPPPHPKKPKKKQIHETFKWHGIKLGNKAKCLCDSKWKHEVVF